MIDSTPDSSRQEQISQIIRTINCSKEGCVIKEYFIDFISTEQKTGHGLSQVIIEKLKEDGLNINYC